VTITNNRFVDMTWRTEQSITVEQFTLTCSNEIYTRIVFENNTNVITGPTKLTSCIYLTLQLSEAGVNDVVIRNNYFENIYLT
jgi:hypothetical protein